MTLIEETSVPDAVLPIEAFKAHLRLGSGFGQDDVQDAVIKSFLRAAIAAIEARTGKVLIARNFGLTLNFWRDPAGQRLPVAPVNRIDAVVIVGPDGSETPVADTAYWLERDAQRPRLRTVAGALPRIATGGSVRIGFEAGYSSDWSDLPPDLQQAVMLLAAHFYEYRNDTGLSDGCMPFGVSSLIERYRVLRLGSGALR